MARKRTNQKRIENPNWPVEITKMALKDDVKKYRYMLFGMAGSWSEYNAFANTKKALYPTAFEHLKFGHDAHIEDLKTGKVWTLRFKKTFEYKEPQ